MVKSIINYNILISLALLLNIGCSKIEKPAAIQILGKGGTGDANSYPMNSKISFLNAINYKIDGVEIDVQMTKDGKLIAYHDDDLNTITNYDGAVYDYDWSELKENCKYINQKFKEYSLISIDEIIDIFPNDAFFSLDLKITATAEDSEFNSKLIQAISDLQLKTNHFAIENNDPVYLQQLKVEQPDVQYYLLSSNPEADLQNLLNYNLDGLVISDMYAEPSIISQAKEEGVTVTIWQQNKTTEKIIALQPDILQTNEVRKFR